jgi:integrase
MHFQILLTVHFQNSLIYPMARRTKGAGCLKLRGRIWWILYSAGGIQIPESSGSTDKRVAEQLLKQRIGEAASGDVDVPSDRATIDDLYALVVADYQLRKLRDLDNVQWRYESHIKEAFGTLPAARFGPRQVRRYVEDRRVAGASDATINRELSIIRRGFKLGEREDPPLVRRVPHIIKLDEDNARQGFIQDGQYRVLLAALPEHLKCLLVVGYHCGNRLGELRKLQWSQVDLAAEEIRIEKRQAKGKRPRTLPIYGEMAEWLEWQQERRAPECDLVFHWKGKPLGSHLKGWDRSCTDAGIEELHFHDLRRSAIRNMERAGIPRSVAMSISGHRTESVYKRYDIVADGDLKAAAKKMTEYHAQQEPQLRVVGGNKVQNKVQCPPGRNK